MAYTNFLFCMGVVVMLAACGDDGSSTNAVEMDASFDASKFDVVVATKDELPKCTDKRDGEKAYVKDKKVTYVCDVGRWVLDDEGKSSSSSGKAKSLSSSSKIKSSSSSIKAKSSSSDKNSSSVNKNSSSSSKFEMKNKTISGVAQKGPFLAESGVKLYELDQKTLAKTGRVFSGKVKSNGEGRFEVKNVELSSPYALLEVNGRFRNEVTGDVSSNEITLRALVNLDGREEVNINLLTHLTYERILYLFGTGVDFAAAKKQAESEFLSAFHVNDKFENFEDLNIFGDSEEGGALLAISVCMLSGTRTDLAKFLDSFVDDFKEDGTWDDESTRYDSGIRRVFWAENVEKIRNNIEDWKVGSVPKFGKYILMIKCRFDGFSNCYEECDVEGSFIKKSTYEWNMCLDGVWFSANVNTVSTYGWDAGIDGELRKSDLTDRYYKYDEVLNDWVVVNVLDPDCSLGLNGCTRKREGEIGLSPKDDIYYVCRHEVDEADGFDGCFWQKAREIDFIKRDKKCDSEDVGRIIPGIDTVTNKYYCSRIGWVNLRTWSFGVPKEFHFNPDINYGSLKDERDGKTYKTVKIGDQVWMAENLNYAGGGIGHCYEDVPENCEAGGRLYKWDVAREVCPEGWHLPSKAEFDTLLSFVKREYEEEQCSLADMLKATSGWNYGYQGCDKVGFSAVPAGGKYIEIYRAPDYIYAGYAALFLTSTEYDEHSVYIMQLNLEMYTGGSFMHYVHGVSLVYDYESTSLEGWPHYNTKESEFSVRCLKDAE